MQTIKLKGKRIRFETNLFGNDPNIRRPDRCCSQGPWSSFQAGDQTPQMHHGRGKEIESRLVQELIGNRGSES